MLAQIKKLNIPLLLIVLLIGLVFNFADLKAQSGCAVWNSDASQMTVPAGCTVNLGNDPVTTARIVNNGRIVVGSGIWTIRANFVQNSGATMSVGADSIDLSQATMTINNSRLSANKYADGEVVIVEFDNQSAGCVTLSLTEVIVRNQNAGNLQINSKCNFILPPAETPATTNDTPIEQAVEQATQALTTIKPLAPILAVPSIPFAFLPALQNLAAVAAAPTDVWFLTLRLVAGVLNVFGFKRKRKYWGTVFDSQTKQPLDPVLVRLIDAKTHAVVEQVISDLYGHFGFLIRRGQFIITAEKKGYLYPSKISMGAQDEIYQNLYHGEVITITSESDVISPNIAMDRLGFDFNQEAKKQYIKFHPWINQAIYLIMNFLFWSGLVLAGYNFLTDRSTFNTVVLVVYFVLLGLKFISPKRLWGRIRSRMNNQALANMVLELNHSDLPGIIVGRAKTDFTGKFFLKAQPGEYILKIKPQTGTDPSFTGNIKIGNTAVFNKDISI